MKKPPLLSFRAGNFKAIRDSGRVTFGWLTVLIGNNGSGKSSLIEAMESFRDIVVEGLDPAMSRWRGFEHAWNKAAKRRLVEKPGHRPGFNQPMQFRFDWKQGQRRFIGQQSITQGPGADTLFIQREQIIQRRADRVEQWTRNDQGEVFFVGRRPPDAEEQVSRMPKLGDGESLLKRFAWETVDRWQFLMLNPERMGQPIPQRRAKTGVRLARDGSNIAEYLDEIRRLDLGAFEGLLASIRCVLPYATDLQPVLTSELERAFYLRLRETSYDVPGWLLSTGTLRIVALLACLRHPNPPPVLVVEEVENGLDPRTLHLLVEEIRVAIAAGTTQVILTTHSPYLLDLLDLSHVVVVEREKDQPVFRRPDAERLAEWSKSFSPGGLYTMGRLTRDGS